MYAGRVANCPLVSRGEYADETDRQTVTLLFPLDAASVKLRSETADFARGVAIWRSRQTTFDVRLFVS